MKLPVSVVLVRLVEAMTLSEATSADPEPIVGVGVADTTVVVVVCTTVLLRVGALVVPDSVIPVETTAEPERAVEELMNSDEVSETIKVVDRPDIVPDVVEF